MEASLRAGEVNHLLNANDHFMETAPRGAEPCLWPGSSAG